MADVIVVGSLNTDIVVKVEKLPMVGETMHGLSIRKFPGGKGANQAVALARLGRSVSIIGAVGNDEDGRILQKGLAENKVDYSLLAQSKDYPTGSAVIIVDQHGNNEIIVLRGANNSVDLDCVRKFENASINAKYLLMQYEIPIHTVENLINLASLNHLPVVINPSPYYPIVDELLQKIDYLVLNETEASSMLREKIDSVEQACKAVSKIVLKGVKCAIITLGSQGAVFCEKSGLVSHIPTFKVEPIDTTGSGDAFLAGFLHGLLAEKPIREAVLFANAVGALTVTKLGAQSSLPYLNEVIEFLGRNANVQH